MLRVEKGNFGLVDMYGARMDSTERLDVRADGARRQGGVRPERHLAAGLADAAGRLRTDAAIARWDGSCETRALRQEVNRRWREIESQSVLEEGAGGGRGGGRGGAGNRARAGRTGGEAGEEGALRADGKPPEKPPLFNGAVLYGNLVFISGIGAHFEGDIKAHTKHVLDEMQKSSRRAGSSMEKVLKVNVYLNDLKDYAGMNEVFLGRFGPEPGVRTTIAAAGGIPGNSLVEIDCIACL